MDRGTWQAMVHGVTESDTTQVTEHARIQQGSPPPRFKGKELDSISCLGKCQGCIVEEAMGWEVP